MAFHRTSVEAQILRKVQYHEYVLLVYLVEILVKHLKKKGSSTYAGRNMLWFVSITFSRKNTRACRIKVSCVIKRYGKWIRKRFSLQSSMIVDNPLRNISNFWYIGQATDLSLWRLLSKRTYPQAKHPGKCGLTGWTDNRANGCVHWHVHKSPLSEEETRSDSSGIQTRNSEVENECITNWTTRAARKDYTVSSLVKTTPFPNTPIEISG